MVETKQRYKQPLWKGPVAAKNVGMTFSNIASGKEARGTASYTHS